MQSWVLWHATIYRYEINRLSKRPGFSMLGAPRLEGREVIVTGNLQLNRSDLDVSYWNRKRLLDMILISPQQIEVLDPDEPAGEGWNVR